MKLLSYDELKPNKGIQYARDHLRKKCAAGEFPQPIKLSPRRIAWLESEIDEHLAALARQRGDAAAA